MKAKTVERIFRAKSRQRKALAALPFEKKIEILVKMQKIAREIRQDPRLSVWKIKGNRLKEKLY